MKLMFFILLLLNVALLIFVFSTGKSTDAVIGSNADTAEPSPPSTAAPPEKVARATVHTEQKPAAIEIVDTELEPTVSQLCFRIGPFDQSREADRIKGELGRVGIKSRRRRSEQKNSDNYWVYLPPYSSKAEAIRASRELAAKGIGDNFVISTGANKNAISLGLYTSKSKAEARYAVLVERGYEPVLDVRPQRRIRYWLSVVTKQLAESEALEILRKAVHTTLGGNHKIQFQHKEC